MSDEDLVEGPYGRGPGDPSGHVMDGPAQSPDPSDTARVRLVNNTEITTIKLTPDEALVPSDRRERVHTTDPTSSDLP
jgi:hypothetical protein